MTNDRVIQLALENYITDTKEMLYDYRNSPGDLRDPEVDEALDALPAALELLQLTLLKGARQ